jgi:hypothetical protein
MRGARRPHPLFAYLPTNVIAGCAQVANLLRAVIESCGYQRSLGLVCGECL